MEDSTDKSNNSKSGQASSNSYEMTAASAGGVSMPDLNEPLPPHKQIEHEQRKRSITHYHSFEPLSICDNLSEASGSTLVIPVPRKKKASSYGTASAYDDDTEDTKSSRTVPDKKQNHSEIEKRRRDKMNTYISELSSLVPMCSAMARKLDKLTVLRMAVQHLRSISGALTACPLSSQPRPAFLSEKELNALILHAAKDSFLLVVGCDRGRLLYVSESTSNILQYEQSELLGQSMFDILHPKDVAKVKEQLSSSDSSPRDRLIDAKTMLPVKAEVTAGVSRLCPGARRSFFCRIKCKTTGSQQNTVKEEQGTNTKLRKKNTHEKKYCVVQCTGYLKLWAPAEMSKGPIGAEDCDACNLSCLVAVVRALPDLAPPLLVWSVPPTRRLQYVSRHALDGKYLFVDQRVTLMLGFLAQELLGTSLYEYISGPELGAVARAHKAALIRCEAHRTPPYSFRRKDGSTVILQTHFKPFRNPWTKDVECLVAQNTLISETGITNVSDVGGAAYLHSAQHDENAGRNGGHSINEGKDSLSDGDVEMQRLIESQVESHKIGSAIAEEALRRNSIEFSPDLPPDLLQDAFNHQFQALLVDNILGGDMSFQVRNNVPLCSASVDMSPQEDEASGYDLEKAEEEIDDEESAPTPPLDTYPPASMALDVNGEAAIDVIMSLLEADAGLGGPVNFSGLPWPLP